MSNEVRTLRPGLLVSLNTSIKGNIHYRTLQLEGVHVDSFGQQRARWETTRVISDPIEHENAVKLRGKVRSLITGVCSISAFGLLCPETNAQALFDAIAQGRAMVDEFNTSAALTRMSVNVIYGHIAADDIEAVRAVTGEIRALMEDMQDGLKALDVKAVRDAANRARSVGAMLSPDAKGRLEVAIDAARSAARSIVKAGAEVAIEIDSVALAKIDMARTSFLDIDAGMFEEVAVPAMPSRGVDLDVTDVSVSPVPVPAYRVDLGA